MNDIPNINDPCHCGSGKKYKKCCLNLLPSVNTTADIIDFEWYKLCRLKNVVLNQHIIPYVKLELPDNIHKCVIAKFFPGDLPDGLEREIFYTPFFLSWFVFNWIPYNDFGLEQFGSEITLAQNYMLMYKDNLNNQERHFIEMMDDTCYSFYSIQRVESNNSLLVKDVLLGLTYTVKRTQGSLTLKLKKGNIIFGQILMLNDQLFFLGTAPYIIPKKYYARIIDLKERLIKKNDDNELTLDILRVKYDMELIDYYFEIAKTCLDPSFS